MQEKLKIPIAEHLEDQDDLLMGRDTELIAGQEHLAKEMADKIYGHAIENGIKAMVFCVSPKKRVLETAKLVEKYLSDKTVKIHILFDVDPNLREMDQGKFILPVEYKAGDDFKGLTIARKVFMREIQNPDNPSQENFNYHFGDPLPREDGTYKYPELKKYFTESGESFKEMLIRYFSEVVKLSENLKRFSDKTEPVIFTHGQPRQFFVILEEIAKKMAGEGHRFEPGDLPRLCRDAYKPRVQGLAPYGQVGFVSVESVYNPEIINILKEEIARLES